MVKEKREKNQDITRVGLESEGLKTLLDISQSLHQYRDLNDLIMFILHSVTKSILAEMSSVLLYDESKNEIVFYSSTDIPERRENLKKIRFPADRGIAGSVLNSGRGELIINASKDPRHFKMVDDITGFKTESMVVVPLKIKKKTIGVLEALNKKKEIFDEKDLNFLMALSPIIAMALDNVRMYSELKRAYNELKLIDKGKDELIREKMHELTLLRKEAERHYLFDQIIGNSDKIKEVLGLCERVIDSEITVLIEGETGTGKELIARAIHYNGPRKDQPFVAQNCSGIPDNLLASELFGHKKGAYTGAFKDKRGLFEIADGGTVFLDEVSEMSAAMQTNLLRVLQDGDIKPLGSERGKRVDIRLISATNRSLKEEMREGRLREDLFYRLSVFAIKLPSLRERVSDIPILASHFLKKFNDKTKKSDIGINQEALDCLTAYAFPGNVRELENEIERAIAMVGNGNLIDVLNLSEKIQLNSNPNSLGVKLQGSLKQMVEILEKSILFQTLEKNMQNKTKTAKELGLSRYGLQKKIQRYGL